LNRRELIGRSATLATVFVAGRYFARAAEGYPFTLGVASGEPTHDGIVLWTRLAPTPLALDGLAASRSRFL
jgi:alkaline phosphatase D